MTATTQSEVTRQDLLSPRGVRLRDELGLLTIEETAERYGIDRERIAEAVHAEELASVTITFTRDGAVLVLEPTADGAVAEWLAAQQ